MFITLLWFSLSLLIKSRWGISILCLLSVELYWEDSCSLSGYQGAWSCQWQWCTQGRCYKIREKCRTLGFWWHLQGQSETCSRPLKGFLLLFFGLFLMWFARLYQVFEIFRQMCWLWVRFKALVSFHISQLINNRLSFGSRMLSSTNSNITSSKKLETASLSFSLLELDMINI